jgi:hypothetical protein
MISSAEVVRRIAAAPAPVLFADSCAFLDLMRDPTRGNFSASQVEAAQRLLLKAERRPRALWLPITAQVWIERNDNQMTVKQEAELRIHSFEEGVHRVQKLLAAHGLQTSAIAPSLVASRFPDTAHAFVDRVFSEAQHVRGAPHTDRRALARMAANLAPSRRGQQTKDCIVIENYLQIARLLREKNFEGRIVFLTTNTKDYSDKAGSGSIHPDLAGEFGAVNMTYSVNFQMAEHQLR